MRKLFLFTLISIFFTISAFSQERSILVPKRIDGAPFKYDDKTDLFGKAYRWFYDGNYSWGVDSLKKLVKEAGVELDPKAYYVVVANFTNSLSPIGLFHGNDDFFSTRMYGLDEDNLYYIFISREPQAPSFLSVVATEKSSPFIENLPAFITLIQPFIGLAQPTLEGEETWIDVRQFKLPKAFRKNADFSFLVKKDLSEEKILAKTVFDNTSLERWSYGIATAITNVNDVDIIIGGDGSIVVRPKPNLDLATFGVINYHFKPVDTKAKTIASSIHLLGGIRLANTLEPILGIGGGIPVGFVDLHLFAGFSVEFANELKDGYFIGQQIKEDVNPFQLKVRGKPRFGIEVKFP